MNAPIREDLLIGRPAPNCVTTVIVGAGQAGLAMSYQLSRRAIKHVLLERAEIGHSWSKQRWDSLRMLSPNWQNRLPGCNNCLHDNSDYMSAREFATYLEGYARQIKAPVQRNTEVMSVHRSGEGYLVQTNRGDWHCQTLVLANGALNKPYTPAIASAVPDSVRSMHSSEYRNPDQIPADGVLIVGASATGLQLAEEIRASGRPVSVSTGEHVRMPRSYRGRDILWWMDKAGLLEESYRDFDDIERRRRLPSPQLAGDKGREIFDLNTLRASGVSIVGRLVGITERGAQFSGSLSNVCKLADLKLGRLLDGIDHWAEYCDVDKTVEPAKRFEPTRVDDIPKLALAWQQEAISTVIWCTGFQPDYSWLNIPVLDHKGQLEHDGGIVSAPGVYALGLPFMRKRKSSFIYGAGSDAADLANHMERYLRCANGVNSPIHEWAEARANWN